MRRFHLKDGSELREQLLALSDLDMAFTYCLLDTPIPLLNYVAHVRLLPVTDGDMTFWHWTSRFDTPAGREAELEQSGRREHLRGGLRGGARPSRPATPREPLMPITVRTFARRRGSLAGARAPAARPAIFGGGTLVMRWCNEGDQSFDTLIRASDPALEQIRTRATAS